ncbi:MAG TPA: T9SS C-terminal target domain-containing protein [Bacteroidetes bacterium]|nr:T9SS C-terminal target domain-containing protein [Bacteroidota bacterium]
MRKTVRLAVVLLLVLPSTVLLAQENPMVYQRWNSFRLNKVATLFNNTGLLCDGNQQNRPLARSPAFEYPNGSGLYWGTSIGFVVGAPADQPDGTWGGVNPDALAFLDGTMDEGSADFWNEEHFAPYAELAAPEMASMSDNPESWPDQWPATYPDTDVPLVVGSEGWPGFGPGGERVADVESFSVAYGWGGTDQLESANSTTRWLKTQMVVRGLAWQGSLYEDFLVWVVVVRNIGTDTIHDLRVGTHIDLGFLPEAWSPAFSDDDRHYWNGDLQLAYATDDNDYEVSPFGGVLSGEEIPWGGVCALRMPGGDHRVASYDASHFWQGQASPSGSGGNPEMYYDWNLMNNNDPQDSNGDHFDDDFDGDGVPDSENGGPGYYVGSGADGLQVIGSSAIDLAPGEADTMIIAVVFGTTREDLFTNAARAISLYENDWQPLTAPPAPTAEAVVGDRKVTLYWDTAAEEDPEFEGYKIYRSADNGVTWGSSTFEDFQGGIHYIPLAQFDLEDGLKGNYESLPEYAWYYLGDDTGLPRLHEVTAEDGLTLFQPGDSVRTFTDRDILNGLTYQYYIAAYDTGNGVVGPLENTPATLPDEINNTVEVIPHAPGALSSLDNVRVVPNPYIVADAFEQGLLRELQFTGLPNRCTITIYNSAGEKVRTIEHDAAGSKAPSIAFWNLLNDDRQLVAPGVYFYHVKSRIGTKEGKFVVIL